MRAIKSAIMRAVNVKPEEMPALLISFVYYFALLCGYYMLRPIRDEMGIEGGVANLQWLFTATFVAMLFMVPMFGWLSSRFRRRHFIPMIYSAVVIMIIAFFFLFHSSFARVWVARAFYVWVSVMNLFVVSVFWSFMTDLYGDEQSQRLFAFIAAGGTTGALLGPAITGLLVQQVGITNLLPIAAIFFVMAIGCVCWLSVWQHSEYHNPSHAVPDVMGGGVWDGIKLLVQSPYLMGVALLIVLYSATSTFLYFQQAWIVSDHFHDAESRTALFAGMDFSVNALTLLFQLFITGRMIQKFGLAYTLMLIPLLVAVAFLGLSIAPVIVTIVVVQILRRAGNYAIMRPARETLYVVLPRQEKYKAKNVIDTSIYRAGDVSSAWLYAGLSSLGLTLSGIAVVGASLACVWAWVSYQLGIAHDKIKK